MYDKQRQKRTLPKGEIPHKGGHSIQAARELIEAPIAPAPLPGQSVFTTFTAMSMGFAKVVNC
ncbi:hypothetical protein N7481_010242 [Penicillium waksmanii]|uniref:uncharacterized protein n=1 Tax=Penicillium waksmanii TaxID=69791 RepID=UPI0025476B9B|nr:uncharacterized protein N7481_010242 [Penicillium waksmanii]KAJ5976535.1 hypothetical protein N7481_010242 [Penicillium waksmanii]